MQNFCFRLVIFFDLRKVGFRLVQRNVFEIDCKNLILLVKSTRFPIYFSGFFRFLPAKAGTLVCNSWSVISFTVHYIWTFACLFAGVFFVSSWKYPLLILESFHLFVRVFNWTFSKNPPTIIGNLPYPLAGCFKKFTVIYYPSTIIETFGTKVDGLHETFFIKTKIL